MSAYTPPLLGPDEQAKASSGMPVATVVAQPVVAQPVVAQQPVVGMPVAQVAAGGQQPMYAQPMYVQQQAPPQQYAQQQYVQQVPLQYVQPVPQQQHSSLGGDTFCSCVEDVGEACLCFWTCGCVSFGQTAERIGRTNCGLGGLLYAFFVVLIPYFLIEAVFSDPPTAEQLNFPPCATPTVTTTPYGYYTNSSCPDTQLLDTQCGPLNNAFNMEEIYMSWVQREAQARRNYNRFCPSAQEALGNVLAGLIAAGFLIHARVGVAEALGITDDAQTKQFAAAVYGLGAHPPSALHRGRQPLSFSCQCHGLSFSPLPSVALCMCRWLALHATGFLGGPVGQILGALLSVDLSILSCTCWFCCVAQCQEHIVVKRAWYANGRQPLAPIMPNQPIYSTP